MGANSLSLPFLSTSAIRSQSASTWIMASLSNTKLVMVGIKITVSNNQAYVCAYDAGSTELTTSNALTTANVNAAWNAKNSTNIATSKASCCYGVSSSSYFVSGIIFFISYAFL